MIRFKAFLGEGLSAIVYHSTNVYKVIQILKSDQFKLSTSVGTSADDDHNKKGKFYYMSFTRSKLGYYTGSGEDSALLVLDGKGLNQRYSGNPVDYWGRSFRMIEPAKNEMEDRLFSNEPFIEKASKYIKEIHVRSSTTKWGGDRDVLRKSKWTREVMKLAKQKKISIFFYEDDQDFILQNKNKSVTPDLSAMVTQKEKGDSWSHFDRDNFGEWEELYYKKKESQLSNGKKTNQKYRKPDARKLLSDLRYDFYRQEKVTLLKNEIHNNKSDPKKVDKILKIMRKEKLKTVDAFVEFIVRKWGDSDGSTKY